MRFLPSIFVIVLLAMPFMVQAQTVKDICKTAKNSADELACAAQKYDVKQAELNDAYDALLAEQKGSAALALREAQMGWAAYKDAQCAWEAGQGSLSRMQELECLVRLTDARRVVLQESKAEDEAVPLVEVPRWLNALSTVEEGTFWQYGQVLDVDLNCDGMDEHVLTGLRSVGDVATVVGLSEDPQTGTPFTRIFDIVPNGGERACGMPMVLRVIEGDDNDACIKGIRVTAAQCEDSIISWNGASYSILHERAIVADE